MKIITNDFEFNGLQDNQNTITVTIGNGQTGSITIFLPNGAKPAANDVIADYAIGTAAELKTKKMVISTVVSDIRPDTDAVIVSIDFNGSNFKTLSDTVEHDHDLISYQTVVKFV